MKRWIVVLFLAASPAVADSPRFFPLCRDGVVAGFRAIVTEPGQITVMFDPQLCKQGDS